MSVHEFASEFDGLRFVRVERKVVLHRPDRANRPNVCPLSAKERVQVQPLGVIQH